MSADLALLSPENRLYAEVLEQMARDRLDGHVGEIERDDELPAGATRFLVESQVWSAGLPEELGGADASLETVALTVMHVAGALPAEALAIADNQAPRARV